MAADNPQAGQGRPLPKKESDLFKGVVKHYEVKQYKKAIKQADSILKKFPNHGETLAMKGLTLNCMSKREEAHALVKKGLMNDMRSHVCWHVYGLLHRSDRNYNEAIKAYKQALKIDPENLQILRDLSLLQVQMRDIKGFGVTRHTLLALKSNAKMNWISFALAKHLDGDLRGAVNVIDIYLGTLTEDSPELERGFESSELAMYRNSLLAEIPDNYEEALEHLDTCEKLVVDRHGLLMSRAKYQLKLGRFQDARETFMTIFKRGASEDYSVHSGYMCSLLEMDDAICEEALNLDGTGTLATMMPLSAEQKQKLKDVYIGGELSEELPRSHAMQRIQLTLREGDDLKNALDIYCKKLLKKGAPSLGTDLSSLFLVDNNGRYERVTDPVDVKAHPNYAMIVQLADGYISSLSSCSKFAADDNDTEEDPSTLLWTWYLRAVLHELGGELSEGLELIEKCLEHTPTAVDLYELKARLLKASGDIKSAVECLDKGRELDKQDRYINNQTTKYMLQAGMEETALERISLFTKHEGNPEQNLFDMQCSWYELELAACLAKKEDWGRSLKKFAAVVKHFDDFHEDQFDFHSYCVRKVTLRAYIAVLRYEDTLWGQQYYGQAAEGIINVYLHLHDNPTITKEEEEPDYSSMTAAQRKKAKAIQRKKKKAAEKKAAEEAEKQKAKEEAAEKENGGKKKQNNKGSQAVVDPDPLGKELLQKDPLEEAKKYSAMLSKYAPNSINTWLLQYDVSIRRGKALMALQALFKAKALAGNVPNSEVFSRIVDFATKADTLKGDNPVVQEVVESELAALLNGGSISDFVTSAVDHVKKNPLSDLSYRVAIAKAIVSTKTSGVADAASIVIDGGINGRGVTASCCHEALVTLKKFGNEADEAVTKWSETVKTKFPLMVETK